MTMAILIKNKLVLQYIKEIQNLQKFRGGQLKKSQVVLEALQQYYISLVKEIVEKQGKEELEKVVSDKELLRKHLIL